ncbi:hypothetical protein LZG75_01825 [Polynucleobacter sp. IMCC30063]|uniref:hypothetical protein n=1 Tax=unclassified Polynucleobacter TaxID=2640945 RepID=UPI001F1F1E27|nr:MULTISPECIES: hypothetical protein [unclassified Polynucleobacter]MCE7504966.1 hypothetical protein [Polynucleobacter sp. IMCC30063]MCE7526243.1 hypothetical protein [Polynucleobacter sp. IMCC 30228]
MPIRKITSQSFDAILSVLGDDPVMQNPVTSSPEPELSARQQNKLAAEAAPAEAKHSLGLQPPAQIRHTFAKPVQWIPSLIGLVSFGALAWTISALIALEQNTHSQFGLLEAQINRLKQALTEQEDTASNYHAELSEQLDQIYTAQLSAGSRSIKSAHNPMRQEALELNRKLKAEEATLSQWRYLGMSTAGQGTVAFFHTGDKTLSLALHTAVLGTWVLSEIRAEHAKLTAATGQVVTLKLKRQP